MGQVTVYSGVERRRRWSLSQKRALVEAAFASGAVVSEVAAAADVRTSQLYRWRRELSAADGGLRAEFAEVVIKPQAHTPAMAPAIQVRLDRACIDIAAGAPATLVTTTLRALSR